MRVEVYNKYWEYYEIYNDIKSVKENDYEFTLYNARGFSKTFDKAIYEYRVIG